MRAQRIEAFQKLLNSSTVAISMDYQHDLSYPGRELRTVPLNEPVPRYHTSPYHYPKWIVDLLGWEYLQRPYAVFLSSYSDRPRVTDQKFESIVVQLRMIPEFEVLDISGTALTDQSLLAIASSAKLKYLIAEDCHISEQGYQDLERWRPDIVVFDDAGQYPGGYVGQRRPSSR